MTINVIDFDLKSTLLSGQCFRVIEENDNSFTVIMYDRVINVKQKKDKLYIESSNMNNIGNIIKEYFDLNRDYQLINDKLCIDYVMKECVKHCNGYRIMKQNPYEMCISYIISQNNNVKRISNSINKLCEIKGEKITFKERDYYLFPKHEILKNITLDELRKTGVGFRDKYIENFLDNYDIINKIDHLDTRDALNRLMMIKGIGLKVASCILLFGYSRFDVFPIDTWVKKFISNKYNIKNDQKSIEKFAIDKFGLYCGLSIQYMFHSERNKKIESNKGE